MILTNNKKNFEDNNGEHRKSLFGKRVTIYLMMLKFRINKVTEEICSRTGMPLSKMRERVKKELLD